MPLDQPSQPLDETMNNSNTTADTITEAVLAAMDGGDGFRRKASPLGTAWDEAMLTDRDIHRSRSRRVMVAPAVTFPTTLTDAVVVRAAGRSAVAAFWVLGVLAGRLASMAAADPQLNPPTSEDTLADMCALYNAAAPSTGPPG